MTLDDFESARKRATTLLGRIDRAERVLGCAGTCMSLVDRANDSPSTALQIQGYLPSPVGGTPGAIWAVAHTDINLLTLIPAQRSPGRRIDVDGVWKVVSAPPESIVMQVGEMLELATRGRLAANLHHVVQMGADEVREPRMPIPWFVRTADGAELVPGTTAAAYRADRSAEMNTLGWRAVARGPRR